MGSAKANIAQSHLALPEADKKSIKNFLKKLFKDTKKDKSKRDPEPPIAQQPKPIAVSRLIENFMKVEIKDEKADSEEDEYNNFERKIVKTEVRAERLDSDVSADSGYAENSNFTKEDLVEDFNKLKVTDTGHEDPKEVLNKEVDKEDSKEVISKEVEQEDSKEVTGDEEKKDDKNKKLHTVFLTRGPSSKKTCFPSVQPYTLRQDSERYRQIYQVNQQTLTGGHVTVNSNQSLNFEIHQALTEVDKNVQHYSEISQNEQAASWQLAQEFVQENDSQTNETDMILSMLSHIPGLDTIESMLQGQTMPENYNPNVQANTDYTDFVPVQFEEVTYQNDISNMFPTPPRSENAFSPMSDQSLYPNPDYTLSPPTSSPIPYVDYEKYQEIANYDECPSAVVENLEKGSETLEKKRERQTSTSSSMTMKQYKDLQKDISAKLSKNECCSINRKPCKEIFEEVIKRLKPEERRNLCLKVASLDLKSAYGVLQHILLALSKSSESEDLQMALFTLICDRVVASEPAHFTRDFGLNLIKSAVLRCYSRPILTRYLVQCVRTALKPVTADKEFVFHEIDDLGDNLISACARGGDKYGNVLAKLLSADVRDIPLFNVHHANSEGYSPLHVACKEHSPANPHLHIVHILLEHGKADLWKGDIKGGESSLHLAVNSSNCDLHLVMILFKHIDRKMWKQLAHTQNRSSMTPLEYARLASKSSTRINYPQEVLEFLKKCR